MKKLTSLILVLTMLVTTLFCFNVTSVLGALNPTSGTCGDNVKWNLNTSTGVLTLSGTGATKDYGETGLKGLAPWNKSRNLIKKIVVEEGVTSLGTLIFNKCTVAESVSLPSTLTKMSDTIVAKYGSFRECTALKSITMPANLESIGQYCFLDCTSLTTVILNDKLTSIGTFAFNGCTSLKSIKFPDSLTSIGISAFQDCSSLATVTYGTGLTETGNMAFRNAGVTKVNFSSTITEVSPWSFYGCKFVSLEVPETIVKINIRGFANCTAMQSATIHNANCVFDGIGQTDASGGKDPFNGSQQSLLIRGHSGSTAQAYATAKGYKFESIDACNHESTHEVITLKPTCTEKGTTTQVCDNCGFVVSETELPAKGHSFETVEKEDNTSTDGHIYEYQQCTVCKAENKIITHVNFVDGYYDYECNATCTTPGWEKKTCKIDGCGKTERKAVAKTGHTIANPTVTKKATCKESGEEKGTCSVCGQEVTQTIPATGHTFSDVTETLDNTSVDGHTYLVETCTVCGEKQSTPTHVKWVEGQYTSAVLIEPKCVVNGVQLDTCNICGERRNVTLPANGEHVWEETSRTEPTCTAAGKIYYKCKNCNFTKSENIEALGHENVVQTQVASTCTAAGYITYKCSRCGALTKEETSPLGHTPDPKTYVITKSSSCTEDGAATATCSICGEKYDIVLSAYGHNYVENETAIEGHPDHKITQEICSRCGDAKEAKVVHIEWVEGNYTTKTLVKGSCIVNSRYQDTCNYEKCGQTRIRTVEAPGSHKYVYTGFDSSTGKLTYKCSVCEDVYTANPTVVLTFWNANNVNKNSADVTNGYLVELSGDGVINAKDYALLKKANAQKSSKG